MGSTEESEAMPDKIKSMVSTKEKISLKSSKINSKLEKYVLLIITEILKKHGQDRFTEMLYTTIKELAINAVKANQKRIFFEVNGLDIFDESQYAEGMVKFKQSFSDKMADEYGQKCMEKGIHVTLNFFFKQDGMHIEVINNTPVIKLEEIRMREKMHKSMQYNDIAEFYMDNMDNTEGAGLGIALIMIMLKGEGIDPNLFRIITKPRETIARIEVPFTKEYVTLRSKGI